MKRGGFWMTTVAAGMAVLGLMTVGRAGLKSQTVMFLQGQMKIAAGDTDSGLKLLAEASSRPQMGASVQAASETAKGSGSEKPCRDWAAAKRNSTTAHKAARTEQASVKVKPAPEPTLASLVTPMIPAPPMVYASYAQDGMGYVPTAQREQLRAQRLEFQRAQRIREQELKKTLREINKYRVSNLPNAQKIEVQVQKDLGVLAQ